MNAEQLSRVGEKLVKRCGSRDPFEIARQLGINVMCKLRSNGMPVPLLRNGYSIFNGTKYR